MDRFLLVCLLALLLILTPVQADGREAAQPVFFSMLFPQLMPQCIEETEAADGYEPYAEAVML